LIDEGEDLLAVHWALAVVSHPLAQTFFVIDMPAAKDHHQLFSILLPILSQTNRTVGLLQCLAKGDPLEAAVFVLVDAVLLPVHESFGSDEKQP
jgi:hypothetical protein